MSQTAQDLEFALGLLVRVVRQMGCPDQMLRPTDEEIDAALLEADRALHGEAPSGTDALADARRREAARAEAVRLCHTLTPREGQVLALLAAGLVRKEVARVLQLGLETVHSHVNTAKKRLGTKSTAAALVMLVRAGMV